MSKAIFIRYLTNLTLYHVSNIIGIKYTHTHSNVFVDEAFHLADVKKMKDLLRSTPVSLSYADV